jgi:hypothetical protein
MPELSQNAIRELRQSLLLIERLLKALAHILKSLDRAPADPLEQLVWFSSMSLPLPLSDIDWLEKASDRVRALTSPKQFETWVGGPISYNSKEQRLEEIHEDSTTISSGFHMIYHLHSYTERLYSYVQGILKNEEAEKNVSRLTQENASLKEQLAELRRRESTYLSIVKEAQTSATYSPSPKDREILLESYRRQRTILIKNLTRYQEDKAKYGLNVPVNILNAIDQAQEDLERIGAQIADLEASKTDTNGKP